MGGPTANFRYPSCDEQKTAGVCPNRKCLAPTPCKHLRAEDHSEYLTLLQKIKALPGIKKVFIRSGLRYDYLLCDQTGAGDAFFKELVRDHVSGQLKVAPEHCSDAVLQDMGKQPIAVFQRFKQRYFQLCIHAQRAIFGTYSSSPGIPFPVDDTALGNFSEKNCDIPQQVRRIRRWCMPCGRVHRSLISSSAKRGLCAPHAGRKAITARIAAIFPSAKRGAGTKSVAYGTPRRFDRLFSPLFGAPRRRKPLQHTVRVARGHDASVTRRTANAGHPSDTTASFGSHQKKTGWAKAKPKRKKPGKNKK